MKAILGVDIGKEEFDVKLEYGEQKEEDAIFDNVPAGHKKLQRFMKKRKVEKAHVCMEATGRYGEVLAEFLYEQGHDVSVVNPARIKAYAKSQLQRNKTDKLDAALIADFCRTQNPPLWTPPSPECRQLQVLVRHLEDLGADYQRQRNRLDALIHSAHPSPVVIDNLNKQIDLLKQQIEQVKAEIQDHIDNHPDMKQQRDLLDSIKGLGPLTAAKLMAEFGNIANFDNVRQLIAFAGLNPTHHQSGKSKRSKTPISKMGRSSIRAALYMPAVSARQYNPILKAFADRLEERGVQGKQITVAVMRKLLHLAYGVLKSGQPFDPNYLENRP